jgi:hypothetical protein
LKNYLSFLFLILISIPIFVSCENSPPIPEKKFIKIYYEMTIMQDTTSLTQAQIRKNLLKKYNFSEEKYDQTIKFYNSSPERWNKFFDKVLIYLQDLQAETRRNEPLILPKRYVLKDM